MCAPRQFFVRTTPIFRPEMMFSYFTPKLHLLDDIINNMTWLKYLI